MNNESRSKIEIRDVATGLWIWRIENPFWEPGADWEPFTTSTCVQSGGEILVLDPQAPPAGTNALWERLDARPPTTVIVLKPDHVRDTDRFVRRYGARPFGPDFFFATIFLRPIWNRLNRVVIFQEEFSLYTMAGVAAKRHSGSHNSVHLSLPMP
jgi:hypothetical protein